MFNKNHGCQSFVGVFVRLMLKKYNIVIDKSNFCVPRFKSDRYKHV